MGKVCSRVTTFPLKDSRSKFVCENYELVKLQNCHDTKLDIFVFPIGSFDNFFSFQYNPQHHLSNIP